jgi:hypothetical protein
MKYVLLVALALTGCATGASKLMKSNAEGGRVMLIGTGTWMEANSLKRAEAEMSQKCPGGYSIVEEGLMERPSSMVSHTNSTHIMEKYIDFKCKI